MNIKNIGKGFLNLIKNELGIPDEEIEKAAQDKVKHCLSCDIRTGNRCDKSKGGCGCYIKAKVRSDSVCPIGKF